MEPVLTNRFRLSEDNLRTSTREQLRTPILLNYIFAVMMLSVAAYLAVPCFRTSPLTLRQLYRPLLFLALAGFLLYEARTMEKRAVAAQLQKMDEVENIRDSDVILQFLPDHFLSDNSTLCRPRQRQYEDITELVRGRTLIYLRQRDHGQFYLDPNRFENGTEEDFWKLMSEKCPKAVPAKYRR